MNKEYKSVGKQIKEARQAKGWSQRQLSRESGVPNNTISTLEAEIFSPSVRVVETLARTLKIKVTVQ